MGESDRFQEYGRKYRSGIALGSDGNNLVNLMVMLGVFFLLMLVLQVGYNVSGKSSSAFNADVVPWLAIPASFAEFINRPWTFITHMFIESGSETWRLITNLVWLWVFGKLFQQMAGNRKLIPVYIYGSIAGGIFFILANALIPSTANVLYGANAGVLAVGAAATTAAPDYRFFRNLGNGIPIWVLFVVFLVIDIIGTSSYGNAHIAAHVGGMLAGLLFMASLKKGRDGSVWMNKVYSKTTGFFSVSQNAKVAPARERFFYEANKRQPFKKDIIVTQEKVDEILDKINMKGYHFLTDEEKNILKRASEEGVR